MAVAPCASMSSNTGFSSGSPFSCIIFAMCSGLLCAEVLCAWWKDHCHMPSQEPRYAL